MRLHAVTISFCGFAVRRLGVLSNARRVRHYLARTRLGRSSGCEVRRLRAHNPERDMSTIEFELAKGTINVDAMIIAEGFGLEPTRILDSLRSGDLTALCEQGIAEDAGRYRLTFFHEDRRLRFTIDRDGQILDRSSVILRPRRPAR